jgi:hypothetical protein
MLPPPRPRHRRRPRSPLPRRSSPTSDKRSRRSGLDPYELAILRGSDSLQGDPEAPDEARPLPRLKFGNLRIGSLGLLGGILVIFLVGSGVRYGGANHTPKLATSCTTPALAISVTTVRRGNPLYFAITGPDRVVVVAIDAASLSSTLTASALPGVREAQVDRVPVRMSRCKGKGLLGVQVQPGDHTIGVFPADGGTPLMTKKLTVTER